jgi:NitT/TauT family transport system permease protein
MTLQSKSAETRFPARSANQPRPSMLPQSVSTVIPPAVFFVVVIGLWQLASAIGLLGQFVAPAPSSIAHDLGGMLGQGFFWSSVETTLVETVAGFAIGVLAGLVFGMLTAIFPIFRRSVYPHALAFQIIPRSALAPLFLLWLGFGLSSKIAMAASMSFFPLVVSTVAGIQAVDRDSQLLMRSLGASRWQMFYHLILPSAAPLVAAGAKLALTLALIGSVIAEFIGGSVGLGVLLTQFQQNLDVPRVYAVIVVLAILGLLLYAILVFAERKIIFWTNKSAL